MLSVSNVVRVTVNLSPQAAAVRSFGILMIAGDSNVINGTERYRTYLGIDGVTADFGVNAPEAQAAALYFGQTPQPSTLMIGRWLRVATAGQNDGGFLTLVEQAIANWTAISSGGFDIVIDGAPQDLSGLDFTGVTNLNGVASVITAALSGGATCVWNGTNFVITSGSTGAGAQASGTITLTANPSYGVQASGTITFTGNPSPGDSVDINGTTVTFVASSPTGNEVLIGGSDTVTAANLQAFLQASADTNLSALTYNTVSLVVTCTARVFGTAGNSYVFTASSSAITISGSGTLAGGVAPDTLTINSVAFTFVKSAPTGNQILVGATAAQTSANIQATLGASTAPDVEEATYSTSGQVTTVTAVLPGTAGNSFTLAKSSSSITLSASTLLGGTVSSSVGYATTGAGTDISQMLMLTASSSQALVPGFNAESPVQCAAVLADLSPAWYGLMFQASVQPTDSQNLAVAPFIEAQDLSRIFGITITNTNVLSDLVSNDLASELKAEGFNRSFTQYSQNQYAIASFFGRAFTVDYTQASSAICLMFKQEPGVAGEDLSVNQALTLQNKNCNVFIDYVNGTTIIQYGTMASGVFFDEIHDTDWFQNQIQTNVYNTLYTSGTKVPQTDAGVNLLTNAISAACNQGVSNGVLAPGTWNGPSFGEIVTGQYLKYGFYIFAQSVALQSQSDRDLRKAPPIQVAAKLAGAIQSADILVDVNQ